MARACCMVISESIVFEKLFHEDHANGGRGVFAGVDRAICAQAWPAPRSVKTRVTDSQRANAFSIKLCISISPKFLDVIQLIPSTSTSRAAMPPSDIAFG